MNIVSEILIVIVTLDGKKTDPISHLNTWHTLVSRNSNLTL